MSSFEFQFEDMFHSTGLRCSSEAQSLSTSLDGAEPYDVNEEDIGSKADIDIEHVASPELRTRERSESITLSTTIGLDSFAVMKLVGKGGFGKVHQVMKKSSKDLYAMKSLRKSHLISTNSVENTIAECDILRKVRHPFIVRLHYAFQNEAKLYLVMDFVNGGHLLHHMSRESMFSENQARFYLAEVILALEHLHNLDIIHRDLKPENVLLDSKGHCVLTDFGFAKENIKDSTSAGSFCGTLEYMAPEVIKKNRYGKPADWWAVGILLYDMLLGHPPFQHDNDNKLYEKIMNDKLKLPTYLTKDCASVLRGMLQRDLNKRFSLKQIKAHAFFKTIDWDKLLRKEIPPPFCPVVEGPHDVSNFDIKLTTIPIGSESPISPALTASLQDLFKGFSYQRSPLLSSGSHFANAHLRI